MSRYQLPVLNANHNVVVGWDDPLETFFAQVEDDNDMILWLGADPREPKITDIAVLREELKEYAIIPDNICENLHQDYLNKHEPTAFQKAMRQIMEEG